MKGIQLGKGSRKPGWPCSGSQQKVCQPHHTWSPGSPGLGCSSCAKPAARQHRLGSPQGLLPRPAPPGPGLGCGTLAAHSWHKACSKGMLVPSRAAIQPQAGSHLGKKVAMQEQQQHGAEQLQGPGCARGAAASPRSGQARRQPRPRCALLQLEEAFRKEQAARPS